MHQIEAKIIEGIVSGKSHQLPHQILRHVGIGVSWFTHLLTAEINPLIGGVPVVFLDQAFAVGQNADQRVAAAVDAIERIVEANVGLDHQVRIVPPVRLDFVAAHQTVIVPGPNRAVGLQ